MPQVSSCPRKAVDVISSEIRQTNLNFGADPSTVIQQADWLTLTFSTIITSAECPIEVKASLPTIEAFNGWYNLYIAVISTASFRGQSGGSR